MSKIITRNRGPVWLGIQIGAWACGLVKLPTWQPIETAPHNRKLVCGFHNELGNFRTVFARYYDKGTLSAGEQMFDDGEDEDGFAPEGWYELTETHDECMPINCLTCWQYLPAPPVPADREGGR